MDHDGLGVAFAMEFCPNGDLWSYVERYGPPQTNTACTWLWQISSALEFLHDSHTIHRDLKPNNVLLDERWVCKVADFGLARVLEDGAGARSQVGTIMYRAPEILTHQPYTEKVDMWALGCTMHSLLTHTLRSINIEVYSNPNLRSDLQAELAEHGHAESLVKLIIELVNMSPAARPSARSVRTTVEELLVMSPATSPIQSPISSMQRSSSARNPMNPDSHSDLIGRAWGAREPRLQSAHSDPPTSPVQSALRSTLNGYDNNRPSGDPCRQGSMQPQVAQRVGLEPEHTPHRRATAPELHHLMGPDTDIDLSALGFV
uniref:non-specific serine/threonine protein kinase n=1 Tax=Eutreptiella gymnastica TaxID=73025 RepID=A0A7S4FRV3_9EUGL